MNTPEMIAETRIAVPVADSQFSVNTAASAFLSAATGGPRNTRLSRPATGNFSADKALNQSLIGFNPQTKTQRLRMIHGSHASATCPFTKLVAGFDAFSIGQISFGFQTLRNKNVAPREQSEATTSTSQGP